MKSIEDDIAAHEDAMRGASTILAAILTGFFLLLAAFCFGCASPANRVLTAENAYYFHLGEYQRSSCATVYAPECAARFEAIKALKLRCTEASDAVKRGGKLPLQLKALKAAEKGIK